MKETKKHTLLKILFIFIILIFICYLYARYLNTTGLKVKEEAVYTNTLPSNYNGFKIAHFSDIHYGRTTFKKDLEVLVREINALNADIVVFTGDLFDSTKISEDDSHLITKSFKDIQAKYFKFAVIGDYDEQYLDIYKNILAESNFTLLDNQAKLVYANSSTPLNIIGLKDTNNISELYQNEYYNLTLIHKPDLIKDLSNTALVLAGHSLGGQIKIPFIGGIRKINGAKTYIDSYYQVNDTKLYISNGIGTQDLSFRLFNKPSITLYRLYKD